MEIKTKCGGNAVRDTMASQGKMETICHTRIFLLFTAAALVSWMALCVPLCNKILPGMPVPYSTALLSACNLSILAAMLWLFWCVIQLLRKRPVLRISEKGIWFRLSLKRQGTIPWRRISRISMDLDGTSILLHLHGLSDWEDALPLKTVPGNGQVLILPLRWKVRRPEQVCQLLQQRQRDFSACPAASIPLPEAEAKELRRRAAMERRGLSACLTAAIFLSSKLWLLWLGLYILSSGAVADALYLHQLAGLGICLPPFLLSWIWLRRWVKRSIKAMQAAVQTREQRESGL